MRFNRECGHAQSRCKLFDKPIFEVFGIHSRGDGGFPGCSDFSAPFSHNFKAALEEAGAASVSLNLPTRGLRNTAGFDQQHRVRLDLVLFNHCLANLVNQRSEITFETVGHLLHNRQLLFAGRCKRKSRGATGP